MHCKEPLNSARCSRCALFGRREELGREWEGRQAFLHGGLAWRGALGGVGVGLLSLPGDERARHTLLPRSPQGVNSGCMVWTRRRALGTLSYGLGLDLGWLGQGTLSHEADLRTAEECSAVCATHP